MSKTRFSPTIKTMSYMRARNYPCAVVEKWIQTGKFGVRRDCFGFDILAIGEVTIGIQAGIGAHHSTKITKALSLPEVRQWLASPTRWFWVMTWSKRAAYKKNGTKSKKSVWVPRVSSLKLEGGEIVVNDFILK